MPRKPKYDDLRTACIDEARHIIEASGLENLSVREVARRLGVSHQAPYKHFSSRDHLLAEVVRQIFQEFALYLEECPRSMGHPEQDLHTLGHAYLQYALENPLQYKLMFETTLPDLAEHPKMMDGAQYAFNLLRTVIEQMALTSNPTHDALFVWATIHGLARLLESQVMVKLSLVDEVQDQTVEYILAGIKASLLARAK